MALRRSRLSRPGVRVLTGVVRALAAVILAIAASAALADLNLQAVDFYRILPVVLTGEGIVYILMLGGGSVAGPILLLTVAGTFVLRMGLAVVAAALAPQAGTDVLAGAQFYYASYWPSAIAQILMMAVMLRVIRPLIRRPRRRSVAPTTPEVDEAEDEERRDLLLVALSESPDEPPESASALEEKEIGDLTDVAPVKREAAAAPAAQDRPLPFEEEDMEAPEPVEEAEGPESVEEDEEVSLPPGVVDARPGVEEDMEAPEPVEEAEGPEYVEEDEEVSLPPGVVDARPGVEEDVEAPEPVEEVEQGEAEATEAVEERPQDTPEAVMTPPGEETERLDPVVEREPEFDLGQVTPPENLKEMVSVISGAAAGDCEVRVWGTSEGRSVLAAVPAGTPAAGTARHADALVNMHLRLCEELGEEASGQQLAVTTVGGWAVQALDEGGGVVLVMATRDEHAIGRLQLATERTVASLRGMAAAAGAVARPQVGREVVLSPEKAFAENISAAAHTVGGKFVEGWRVWRGPHRRLVAAIAPPGGEAERVALMAARAAAPVERFSDSIALGQPEWLSVSSGSGLLMLAWCETGGEPMVISALAPGETAIGRARWELGEIARRISE